MRPDIEVFFHEPTFTFSYVVFDADGGKCVIIDPVLDFDAKSGRTSTEAADRIAAFVTDKGLDAQWILETHVRDSISEDEYVSMRSARDQTLDVPALLLPSVQVNMRAGRFPPAEDNGVSYLKLPINAL
ncbi:MAG: hypothetical protein BMS9Abin01_0458 [Gammaproteobacteria bacterium]|nr:MAG: hypothetical protein BMS9Abin01_0458 [Gammaproteobacteria bacterium]